MTGQKHPLSQMTVIEATQRLEEFKQKLVDEDYEKMIEDGEVEAKVTFEVLEGLEVILYYLETLSDAPIDDDL